MSSTRYSWPVLVKLYSSRQVLQKYSNIECQENATRGSRVVRKWTSVVERKWVFEISGKSKPNENKTEPGVRLQAQGNPQTFVLGALFW